MKIGIDLRPLQEYSRFRGIGTVTYELTKSLLENYPKEQYYFFVYGDLPKPDLPEIFNKGKSIGFDRSVKDYVIGGFFNKLSRQNLAITEPIGVFLATDPQKNLPAGDFKRVVVFYDIINLLFTQKYLATPSKNLSISMVKLLKLSRFQIAKRIISKNFNSALQADRILAISQATKDDIVSYFKIDKDKITVMHLAAASRFKKLANEGKEVFLKKFKIEKPFILYVGGVDYRKNVLRLVKAVNILKEKNKFPYQLVLIGKDLGRKNMPEAMEIRKFLDKENLWERVKLIDFVENDDLVKFYNFAELFAFPTIYEGFGLGVIEAMQCGTAVVCSDMAAIKEVGGESVLYFDPQSPKDIAEKIEKLLTDRPLRKKLISLGFEQAKKFSWKKTAQIAHDSLINID